MARATFDRGAKIRRWERKLDNPTVALKQIGVMLTAESQRAFQRQRFGKKRWPPRGKVNVFGIISDFHQGRSAPPQRRFQRRPALVDTGRLAASISYTIIGKDVVEVGSNLPYAGVHHAGGEVESLPITEQVQRLLAEWLKERGATHKQRLGWLLNKKYRDQTLTMEVPERPIVGLTPQIIRDVKETVGVTIMEVR